MTSDPQFEMRRPIQAMPSDPATTDLRVGDAAPMFSYMGEDGAWHRLEELSATGPLLLVFGARDQDVRGIDALRDVFRDLGVTPVAVLRMPTRSTRSMAKRLGVEGALLADPMGAIAGLYNSLDRSGGNAAPSYFVLDERRVIRALLYGTLPPAEMLLASAARALGRPLPASIMSAEEQ